MKSKHQIDHWLIVYFRLYQGAKKAHKTFSHKTLSGQSGHRSSQLGIRTKKIYVPWVPRITHKSLTPGPWPPGRETPPVTRVVTGQKDLCLCEMFPWNFCSFAVQGHGNLGLKFLLKFFCSECPSKTRLKTSWKTSWQTSRKTSPRTAPLQNGNFARNFALQKSGPEKGVITKGVFSLEGSLESLESLESLNALESLERYILKIASKEPRGWDRSKCSKSQIASR